MSKKCALHWIQAFDYSYPILICWVREKYFACCQVAPSLQGALLPVHALVRQHRNILIQGHESATFSGRIPLLQSLLQIFPASNSPHESRSRSKDLDRRMQGCYKGSNPGTFVLHTLIPHCRPHDDLFLHKNFFSSTSLSTASCASWAAIEEKKNSIERVNNTRIAQITHAEELSKHQETSEWKRIIRQKVQMGC